MQVSKASQKIPNNSILPSKILICYCVGKRSKPKNFEVKKVLNYQLSNASPKMSNSRYSFTKLNPDTFLCRQAKQAKKCQIVVVLESQILMYYLKASKVSPKMSNSTCFTNSNPNILQCRKAKQAKKFKKKFCITNCQMQAQKCQIVDTHLPS